MSFLDRVVDGARPQKQALGASSVVEQMFGGMFETETEAGEHVSVEKSLGIPALLKAIRLLSEVPGALPAITYEAQGEGKRAEDHDSFELLHEEPNPTMGAVEFWTMLFNHLSAWGRLYCGKQLGLDGKVRALWPLQPNSVRPERRSNGEIVFNEYVSNGPARQWSSREMIYVRLFTVDGVNGLSPISLAREAMGMGIAMRRHASRFFRDSAIPSGALEIPDEIKDPATRERIRAEWRARHQRTHDIAILDAGAKFNTISAPLKDLQFVELTGMSRSDVADVMNMPASLLNAATGDSFTYGNREADATQFLTFTLHNPLRKVEQAFTRDRDLFPRPSGRKTHFMEFLREDLMRPDSPARATFYTAALNPETGWMRREEVRKRENLPAESEQDLARLIKPNGNGQHQEATLQ